MPLIAADIHIKIYIRTHKIYKRKDADVWINLRKSKQKKVKKNDCKLKKTNLCKFRISASTSADEN